MVAASFRVFPRQPTDCITLTKLIAVVVSPMNCKRDCTSVFCVIPDEFRAEQERNRMLQEDMEATLHDIQNM